MQYIKGIESYTCTRPSAVTLGKFDGLHRGHQKLVNQVVEFGRLDDMKSIVCAFDMLPLYERMNLPKKELMTKEERRMRLENQVDFLVDCPFTDDFSKMEAEDFIKNVLAGVFHAAFVVVGADFRFGHGKRGDIHMLAAYEKQYDYQLIVIEKERYEDREISSTYVKEALREGDMKLAEKLLGYPYTIAGTVEHGRKLGRTLGFPTFNVPPAKEKLMPPNGVYINRVWVGKKRYNAICNVGVKPTVTDSNRMLVESFLFDYNKDAYGEEVQIELLKFIRPEKKFADIQEMRHRIDEDICSGREFFIREK